MMLLTLTSLTHYVAEKNVHGLNLSPTSMRKPPQCPAESLLLVSLVRPHAMLGYLTSSHYKVYHPDCNLSFLLYTTFKASSASQNCCSLVDGLPKQPSSPCLKGKCSLRTVWFIMLTDSIGGLTHFLLLEPCYQEQVIETP